jgi:hypothetical protein
MPEVLGERASVLADVARVHIGAAEIAMRKGSAARPGVERVKAWTRAAEQFEKASAELAKAAAAARERAGEA